MTDQPKPLSDSPELRAIVSTYLSEGAEVGYMLAVDRIRLLERQLADRTFERDEFERSRDNWRAEADRVDLQLAEAREALQEWEYETEYDGRVEMRCFYCDTEQPRDRKETHASDCRRELALRKAAESSHDRPD